MASLATVPDLEARIGPLNNQQRSRADALLEDASAIVRDDTLREFEEVSAEVAILRPVGIELLLPRRPVSAVVSVTALDCPPGQDLLLDAHLWCFDRIDRIRLEYIGGSSIDTYPYQAGAETYQVVYDHGDAAIPAIVKTVVCGMVNRVLTSPSMSDGLTQETIGQYGYQVQQSVGTQGTEVRYTATDRRRLRRYRKTAGTIVADNR